MVTIVQALNKLGDIDLMSKRDAEFIAEMKRRGWESWTIDDVKHLERLWHKFMQEVQR